MKKNIHEVFRAFKMNCDKIGSVISLKWFKSRRESFEPVENYLRTGQWMHFIAGVTEYPQLISHLMSDPTCQRWCERSPNWVTDLQGSLHLARRSLNCQKIIGQIALLKRKKSIYPKMGKKDSPDVNQFVEQMEYFLKIHFTKNLSWQFKFTCSTAGVESDHHWIGFDGYLNPNDNS